MSSSIPGPCSQADSPNGIATASSHQWYFGHIGAAIRFVSQKWVWCQVQECLKCGRYAPCFFKPVWPARGSGMLTTNNISSLDKGMKDRCVLVEMNAASTGQLLPIARKVAADSNVVLNDTELTAEIVAANGSMRELMSRIKRLARRAQGMSIINPKQ